MLVVVTVVVVVFCMGISGGIFPVMGGGPFLVQ